MFEKVPKLFSQKEIDEKRKYVHDTMIKKYKMNGNFESISGNNLIELWNLYDNIFFGGEVSKKLLKDGSTLNFKVIKGNRSTSGGWCDTSKTPKRKHCHFIISIPAGVYFRLFTKGERGKKANGVECWDRLSCLQIVFEHEVIHMLMQLYGYEGRITEGKGKQIFSAHGKLFQCMTYIYFGHTDFKHSLLSEVEASELPELKDLKPGMNVRIDRKGGKIYGKIDKILKKNVLWIETNPVPGRIWRSHPHAIKLV